MEVSIVSENVMIEIKNQEMKSSKEEKWLYEMITGLLDRLMAFIFLIATLPILITFAALIKIEDGGPIFYFQNRIGKDGRSFVVYKMRSMCVDSTGNGSVETEVNDPRITKVGKVIRLTRIDEIPQLLNILLGNMKLIGPRPLVLEQVIEYSDELPDFMNRLAVKPGVTGWAQVNGGNEVTPEEKLRLDLEYIENRGFSMYIGIIFKTIWVVLTGDGAR